ncbi:MAG: carboxypeptidase-like regulatory domain-containing protein [Bacteroidota bacterium]|nr:carboxypeptidase-like regulatory domain-containing protein [Bacteroidota bacterium]
MNLQGLKTLNGTNREGDFSFRKSTLGGPYTVKISFVGFENQTRTINILNQGDKISLEFIMNDVP